MNSLIEITTVPIEIRMKTTNATLEYSRGTAELELSRSENGNVDIRSRAIKLQPDRYEPFGSGRPRVTASSPAAVGGSSSAVSPQSAYEVTSVSMRQGELLLNATVGQEFGQLFFGGGSSSAQVDAGGQEAAPAVTATFPGGAGDGGNTNFQIAYEMDKTLFNMKQQGETTFKFTPGNIEFSVEQRPEVIIKYTGRPLYVPRSADPNYEPVDVKA